HSFSISLLICYRTVRTHTYTLSLHDALPIYFDPEKAKKLLMQAGYPGGVGFPEVSLLVNSGNTRNNTVAAEIQRHLKENLNVNIDRKSTRLNSSHVEISYAVFCLKKKKRERI